MINIGTEFGLTIPLMSRLEWKAVKPTERDTLWTPIPYVRLTTTKSKKFYNTQDVIDEVRKLQERYMKYFNKPDIPWNFLIGPDGMVYKGRGWFVEPSRPKEYKYLAGKSVDIAFITKLKPEEDPSWLMMKTAMDLIQYGVLMHYVDPTFKMVPFRDIYVDD